MPQNYPHISARLNSTHERSAHVLSRAYVHADCCTCGAPRDTPHTCQHEHTHVTHQCANTRMSHISALDSSLLDSSHACGLLYPTDTHAHTLQAAHCNDTLQAAHCNDTHLYHYVGSLQYPPQLSPHF